MSGKLLSERKKNVPVGIHGIKLATSWSSRMKTGWVLNEAFLLSKQFV